ncbi:MAG: hypothetical protein Q9227_004064 [Pyrenula ochraceoflavens]
MSRPLLDDWEMFLGTVASVPSCNVGTATKENDNESTEDRPHKKGAMCPDVGTMEWLDQAETENPGIKDTFVEKFLDSRSEARLRKCLTKGIRKSGRRSTRRWPRLNPLGPDKAFAEIRHDIKQHIWNIEKTAQVHGTRSVPLETMEHLPAYVSALNDHVLEIDDRISELEDNHEATLNSLTDLTFGAIKAREEIQNRNTEDLKARVGDAHSCPNPASPRKMLVPKGMSPQEFEYQVLERKYQLLQVQCYGAESRLSKGLENVTRERDELQIKLKYAQSFHADRVRQLETKIRNQKEQLRRGKPETHS